MTERIEDAYDAIIIGAGAGGGVAAAVLAEAGKRVLVLERGQDLGYQEISRDHLRNHRLELYGNNTGPDAQWPRVFVDPGGQARIVAPNEGGYNNNAMTVGGGTRVYGAQAWRFMPRDFRMASTYGVPKGSSLADWPIDYTELEPHYDRAEWELGVSGDGDANLRQGPRRRGYPMPPVPDNPQGRLLRESAAKLGWATHPVPLLINSTAYNNRPACVQCGNCVGFACPSESKNGSHNTVLPRALKTGNCTLRSDVFVQRVDTDEKGKVTGATFVNTRGPDQTPHHARARYVVVAAGAIESARLLLNSASPHHPRGLGNASDQVGRNIQGHYYPAAFGLMDEAHHDSRGPGPTIATCQFNHGNPGIIGGGMICNEFIKMPISFWKACLPPDLPRWGLAAKRFMRENYRRVIHLTGPVQDIPSPHGRVTVDPRVRDRSGMPVARLSGTTHPQTLLTADFMRDRACEWLTASGAARVWSNRWQLMLSAGQHQAGTCRMGDDARTSVTDRWGRVHGHDNLYITDGSVHVTNGGFNPVLTILALAFRNAEYLARAI